MKIFKFVYIFLIFSFSTHSKDYKILSIPAGGASGIISAILLKHIEDETNRNTAELFDEIWGSSAGSIIAGLVSLPKNQRKKAEEVVNFFEETFSTIYSAYSIREKFKSIVGNSLLKNSSVPIRVLTGSAFNTKENKWNLYGFDSYNNCNLALAEVVGASCTVYPYLYLWPYKINLSESEPSYFIDAGSLCCELATPDPTAFFLKQFLKTMCKNDTLTVYFLPNTFTQSIDYADVFKVLEKSGWNYAIRYHDGSCSFQSNAKINIVNIPMKIDYSEVINNYLKELNYINKAKIIFLRLLLEKILGKENADANLLGTGLISVTTFKNEAQKIISNSSNFKFMLNDLTLR
jgi:patatin-like phospholipase/acyl hydrolase